MEIKTATIKAWNKGSFHSDSIENVTHVKILPYLSIVQSVEGSYDIALGDGKQMQTGEGGFFIAPSGVQQHIVHHVSKESNGMSCRWIFLDVEINKVFSLDSLYQFPVVIGDGIKEELNTLFDRLFATDDVWENYSDCYQLLGLLLQTATPIRNELQSGIQKAIAYVAEHYSEQITVAKLASVSNMSESNFYAVFKKQVGASPIAYLNRYRLSAAADKLAMTEDTVNEISYSVGITDPLYFRKLFKRAYGASPKEYRLLYKSKT